jgi:tRNA-specific 2-thiouridylase
VRYTGREIAARLEPVAPDIVKVHLTEPARDVTPGQAVVFYQNDRVLGGGIIQI